MKSRSRKAGDHRKGHSPLSMDILKYRGQNQRQSLGLSDGEWQQYWSGLGEKTWKGESPSRPRSDVNKLILQPGPDSTCIVPWTQQRPEQGGRSGQHSCGWQSFQQAVLSNIRALVLLFVGLTQQHGSWLILISELFNSPWSSSINGRDRGG